MTQIPRPSLEVNIGDFSMRLRNLKKAMGAKNNVPVAELLGVSTKSVGDWIRETSEPRLARRRQLEKAIDDEILRLRMKPEPTDSPEPRPPTDSPEPEMETQSIEAGPMARSLLPDDLRWEI